MAARSSGMPWPVLAEVAITRGNAAGRFRIASFDPLAALRQVGFAQLITFGEDDLVADSGPVERLEGLLVIALMPWRASISK